MIGQWRSGSLNSRFQRREVSLRLDACISSHSSGRRETCGKEGRLGSGGQGAGSACWLLKLPLSDVKKYSKVSENN